MTAVPAGSGCHPEGRAQYLQRGDETVNSDAYLRLDENVQVQVGGGVPARNTWTYTEGDINPNELVYPIRGAMDNYLCGKVQHGSVLEKEGKNCTLWHWARAAGPFYRTRFGDWKSTMMDLDAQQVADRPPRPDKAGVPALSLPSSPAIESAHGKPWADSIA